MFGKMGDLMGKMQEMKQKSEEVKSRLETIIVEGQAENNSVVVKCNGNRKVTEVKIENMGAFEKEQLEDYILLATNKALEAAEKVNEAEMQSIAKGMLPGFM
ncbi:MAG: nucleoid-associated protein, YbaB/EbfC family [Verrucomicrobia bacterium]|nr:nucleoid-associated protein, YbaB/EbfC family [Verrucomicrobiota bacterium]|tara:strand:+ start:194 stop:499 length:306 start_codon:yes stop_codon:yes gene_type:complete